MKLTDGLIRSARRIATSSNSAGVTCLLRTSPPSRAHRGQGSRLPKTASWFPRYDYDVTFINRASHRLCWLGQGSARAARRASAPEASTLSGRHRRRAPGLRQQGCDGLHVTGQVGEVRVAPNVDLRQELIHHAAQRIGNGQRPRSSAQGPPAACRRDAIASAARTYHSRLKAWNRSARRLHASSATSGAPSVQCWLGTRGNTLRWSGGCALESQRRLAWIAPGARSGMTGIDPTGLPAPRPGRRSSGRTCRARGGLHHDVRHPDRSRILH